jgi:hypothetical protein
MKLHLDKQLFRQAVQFTADQMEIPAIYIEKDYWVTFALFTIFNHDIGKDTVFKGGTALSKCYSMIERFSEDIDLVVVRREDESNNKLTNKIKKISEVVSKVLPEVTIEGLTHKMGMNRKTAHAYSKEFQGDYGQVRDAIVIEATWLGYHEPYSVKAISSMVGDMMINNNQADLAEQNGLLPFDVNVLDPTRTVCEKIMSLVRFSYGEDALEDLKKKVRHTYDLHQLLQQKDVATFFNSAAFDEMLLKVAADDIVSFKSNNKWLAKHPNEALFFNDPEKVWEAIEPVYNTNFKSMVYGDLPAAADVLMTMQAIKKRLSAVEWNIVVPD